VAPPTASTTVDRVTERVFRDKLYGEFEPLVSRLIHRYGTDAEMRKDLSGEIFARFNDLLEAYDPSRGVPLRPYLVRQLNASIYTYARARWNHHARELTCQIDSPLVESSAVEDPTDSWDHTLAQEPVATAIASALQCLSKRQRQVVILRYFEDRSFEEIGAQLSIRPATARSLLRNALRHLRERLASARTLIE
jgi:RNA polymerase sigma factor (sigma-70 family)